MVTTAQAIEYYTHQQPKRGRYLCPFHPDHHPSLTIKNGFWQCWSCGEHGDIIDFVMKYFGIGFQEAICRINDDFDLGLELGEHVNDDPAERLWETIRYECSKVNKQKIAEYRQGITDQINKLTICHRLLLQHGASEETLKTYLQEIDDLIQEEAFWQ